MRRFGVLHFIAIALVIFGTVALFAGVIPRPARQLSSDSGSTLALGDDTLLLVGVVVAVLLGSVALAGGLAFIFWLLNREVKQAEVSDNAPTNPLAYRTYGHALAFGLPFILTVGLMGLLFQVQMLPVAATQEAEITDTLFQIEYIVISIFFGLVLGLLIHSLLYFRAEKGDMSDGKHIHGNLKLEILWTVIPLIIVMVLGIYTVGRLNAITEEKDGEIGVNVVGFQWGWQFVYPREMFFSDAEFAELDPEQQQLILNAGGITSADLVLLEGQTVRLEMTSVDVIHSFWVPEMRVKQDVVPGVETILRYTPILPGVYRVRCAELCGLNHWQMYANVDVRSAASYTEWIQQRKASFGDPVEAGRAIHVQRCQTCHSIDGSEKTGPTWDNIIGAEHVMDNGDRVLVDFTYVQESIWNPNTQIVEGYSANLMPQNFQQLIPSTLEIEQIYAYICYLSEETAPNDPLCVELLSKSSVGKEDVGVEGNAVEETNGTDESSMEDSGDEAQN